MIFILRSSKTRTGAGLPTCDCSLLFLVGRRIGYSSGQRTKVSRLMRDYKIGRSSGTGLLYGRSLGLFCKEDFIPSENNSRLNDIEHQRVLLMLLS